MPFPRPIYRTDGTIWEGYRCVYYTRNGEEWRIPAWRLLRSASEKHHWNEGFERFSGMLFGYEDWQNDWWIAYHRERRGAWGSLPLYCAINAAELARIEAAGYRTLAPVGNVSITVTMMCERPDSRTASRMMDQPGSVALVRLGTAGPFFRGLTKAQTGPTYTISAECVPELNGSIIDEIEIIARRECP